MAMVKASDYAKSEEARRAEAAALGKPAISTAMNASQSNTSPQNYQNMDWRDQLKLFQTDRTTGQSELQRAMNQANLYKATGDNDSLNRANTWIGQINTAMGGSANPNDSKTAMQKAMDNMNAYANSAKPFEFKTASPFTYSAESDPQYQNALKMALQNAQQATGNAMVGLGSRGIGNSSIAVDRANQIQQREVGNVTSNILSQLIQQAYQRYQDSVNNDYRTQAANYGVQQDQFANQSALYNALFGTEQAGLDREAQTKRDNWNAYMDSVGLTGNLGTGPKTNWSFLGGTDGAQTMAGNASVIQNTNASLQQEGQRIANELSKLELANYPEEQRLRIQQLQKQIAQIGARPAQSAADAEMDQIRLEMAREELKKVQNGGSSVSLDAIIKDIENSPFVSNEKSTGYFNADGSETTTSRNTIYDSDGLKRYIDSLPVTNQQKFQLYRRFNIDTTALNQGGGGTPEITDDEILQYLK